MERAWRRPVVRLGLGLALAAVYALPLFAPPLPAALGAATPPDAPLLARIFPGVPPLWVAVRLAALAGAAALLAGRLPAPAAGLGVAPVASVAARPFRIAALVLAAAHLAAVAVASGLGPAGQAAYLAALALPALALALGERTAARGSAAACDPEGVRRATADAPRAAWTAAPTVAVVAVWIVARCVTDLGSPRTADVVDGWRGFLDTFRLVSERQNLLTELFDPRLPGVSAIVGALQGVPLFQAGTVSFGLRAVQAFQIAWVAATGMLVALLARALVGPGAAALAAAVFLFAPFTRFVTFFPGPFLAGPLYAVLAALAALRAVRRRSAAGCAALGAVAGVGVGFPSVVPLLGVVVAWTLWRLRADLATLAPGIVAGLLSFAAVVAPAASTVFAPERFASHLRWDGHVGVIDAGLLGQIPVATTPPAYEGVAPRRLDVVVSALLAPFANPRIAIRLWGDALVDPLGAVLLACGLAACLRSLRHAWLARTLLVAYVVVLLPAFVSPVDVANVTYAVVLPVAAAVVASAGARAVVGAVPPRGITTALAAVAAIGGSLLFDVVNPRVLPASSLGVMLEVTDASALDRVVVLGYGPGFVRPTKTLYTGPITAFAGPRPVGYLEYDAGPLPVADMAAERKDLLVWSHGYDRDVPIAAAVCAAWPDAVLYEIADRSGLGRVHAARLGAAPWEPRAAAGRVRTRTCRGGA